MVTLRVCSLSKTGLKFGHEILDFSLSDRSGDLLLADPLASLGVLVDSLGVVFLGDELADWGLTLGLCNESRLGADGSVNLGIKVTHRFNLSGSEALVPLRELGLELLWLCLEHGEVVLDVLSEDVLLHDLCVEFRR